MFSNGNKCIHQFTSHSDIARSPNSNSFKAVVIFHVVTTLGRLHTEQALCKANRKCPSLCILLIISYRSIATSHLDLLALFRPANEQHMTWPKHSHSWRHQQCRYLTVLIALTAGIVVCCCRKRVEMQSQNLITSDIIVTL
jgi:hypothetical protein